GRTRHDRAPGAVCGGHRRRRLVESAALRGRAERLRRGAGVGQDLRGGRLPGAEAHRQLPAREGRDRLPGGAADDRRDRSAGRPPRGAGKMSMDQRQFEALVQRMERFAVRAPGTYRSWVLALALFGYTLLLALVIVLLLLLALLAFGLRHAAWLSVKLGLVAG